LRYGEKMLIHLFSMAFESFQSLQSGAFRKALVITLSSIAFGGVTIGVYKAIHSPLFLVQVVEVTTQNGDSISSSQALAQTQGDPTKQWTPIDADKISDLASIPVGEVNLFDLDLRSVEKRILKNEWIREVKLQKRFPQTLSITAIFREPKAIVTLENGSLAYVDTDGKSFGKINLLSQSDLPMLSGFESENAPQLLLALQLIDQWFKSSLGPSTRIESLSFDAERGYRALLSYQIKVPQGTHQQRVRVDLGLPNDVMPGGILSHDEIQRLTQVFQYLRQNSIAARQVFADSGKKIVVKTAHGS
jgi:cell division septal protein FtsQ